MILYKLSQCVRVGISDTEWIQLDVNERKQPLVDYAKTILQYTPTAVLALRKHEETYEEIE